MDRRDFIKLSGLTGLVTLISPTGVVQAFSPQQLADLDQLFINPPDSARPYTMWFWMNGHVTKEGITKDLESMKRVGIGGVFNFDAGTGIPKGPVEYLSPEWLELKKHAINEAARLGLAFTMHNCPGWSSSGGPWITPDKAMQQLTWSETVVKGGKTIKLKIPLPFHKHDYYKDITVLAYPSLQGEISLQESVSKITTSSGAVKLKSHSQTEEGINAKINDGSAWILFQFKKPHTATSLSFITERIDYKSDEWQGDEKIFLETSENGIDFKEIGEGHIHGDHFFKEPTKAVEINFSEIKSTYFRIRANRSRSFSQIRFSNIHRFEDWKKRANFLYNGTGKKDITDPGKDIIIQDSILDISSYINEAGELNWKAPAGRWTILRIGFTPAGEVNHAAPDSGIGLECDKYSKEAISFHFTKMMEILLPAIGPLVKKGQMGLEIDSYEVGMQNWTPGFENEFQKRNNYELLKLLPAMTGRIVDNTDTTERFLLDLRRTQADLIAENYYGRFDELCNEQGIISFIQPYDRGPMEEMQIGSRADNVMGEFWNGLSLLFQNNWMMRRSCKLASSIAHVNGQLITGAEAFTGEPHSASWQEYPFMMKAAGDKAFTNGINRMIIHRFAHQAYDNALPGMTMGPWGIHFDRTNTWWEPGKAWLTYLSRCQHLLRQGLFVADFAYFTGEEPGVYTIVNREELNPPPPYGYDYDLINSEVLLKKAKVVNNRLVLPDGMSYQVLVFQQYKTVSLDLLKKLRKLVYEGLTIIGGAPSGMPGLKTKDAKSEEEFAKLIIDLWGNGEERIDNRVGKGRVLWGQSMTEILEAIDLKKDFEFTSLSGDAPVLYIHRKTEDEDIYFLTNQRRTEEEIVATFRVENKKPEIWDAQSGNSIPVPVYESVNGRIKLPLRLSSYGSLFIVFRKKVSQPAIVAVEHEHQLVLGTKDYLPVRKKLYPDIQDTFTISFWAKPELNVMLDTNNFMEYVKDSWTDYYAIYPPPGNKLYGKGHSTAGITVGRNGVAVWEHGEYKPVFVFSVSASLSGWNHIALVYEEGIPAIYVNGKLIGKGERASKNVHPGTGQAYVNEGSSYYNGDMSEPQLYAEAFTESRIKELLSVPYEKNTSRLPIAEPVSAKNPSLLFWKNGMYTFTDSKGRSTKLSLSGIEDSFILEGPWEISFPPKLGAPEKIILPVLHSLHQHEESGVKYFSGTATYSKKFVLQDKDISKEKRIFLDLGRVEVMAEVIVNNINLGILWSRSYRIDITDAIKPGTNDLQIKVTNQWVNRLIGDEQLSDDTKFTSGADHMFAVLVNGAIEKLPDWYVEGKSKPDNGRITFTTWKHYKKDSPLLESGLIGPVVIQHAIVRAIPKLS